MIDVKKLLKAHNKNIVSESGDELNMVCWFCKPVDGDAHLSMNVKTGQYHCFECDAAGNLQSLGWIPGKVRYSLLTDAALFYQKNFVYTDYWKERGFTAETLKHFGIGFAADLQGKENYLLNHLVRQGHDRQIALDCGLFREDGTDYFSSRWTIPYWKDGYVTSIRGRVPPSQSGAKYLSMHGDFVLLYNEDALSKGQGPLLICEGETDTMMAVQEGFRAVGIGGAQAMTGWVAEKLAGVPDAVLVMDGDNAGRTGARKVVSMIGGARIADLPDDTDLCEYLLTHTNRDLQQLIDESKQFVPTNGEKKQIQRNVTEPNSFRTEADIIVLMSKHPELVSTVLGRINARHFIDDLCCAAFTLFGSHSGVLHRQRITELLTPRFSYPIENQLTDMFSTSVCSEDVETLMTTLEELLARRSVLTNLETVRRKALNLGNSVGDLSNSIASLHTELVAKDSRIKLYQAGEYLDAFDDTSKKRLAGSKWSTGFTTLDEAYTLGLQPGKLSLIAGRPSMGKSLFRANLKLHLCEQGASVLDISPEQDLGLEMDRLIAMGTGIHATVVARYSDWKEDDPERAERVRTFINSIDSIWKWHFVPNKNITWQDVVSLIRKVKMQWPLDIVFIDLFDRLAEVKQTRAGEMAYKIGTLLDDVAEIAEKENVHVCCLVQITRFKPDKRKSIDSYRPTLEDLYASGAWEQRVDIAHLLFRPGFYDRDLPDDLLEVDIAKQRAGTRVIVPLRFESEILKLSDFPKKVED